MNFLEKDLEQIIYESDREKLSYRGLIINGKLFRQLNIGKYGIADLVSHTKPIYDKKTKKFTRGTITVYELKRGVVDINAFMQGINYIKGITVYLNNRGLRKNYDYELVLVGSSFELNSSFIFLTDLINNKNYNEEIGVGLDGFSLTFLKYKYKLEGIFFDMLYGYSITDDGFTNSY